MASIVQSGEMFSAQVLNADVTSLVAAGVSLYGDQSVRIYSAAGTRNGRIVFEVSNDEPSAVKGGTADWSSGVLLDPGAGYCSDISLLANVAFSRIMHVESFSRYMRFRYVAGSATGGALTISALRKDT